MNKLIALLILFLVFAGCRNDPEPKNAIKRDKYIDVLVDVHIAEAMYADRFRYKYDSVQSSALYLSVLEKYNVTEDQMLLTALYYSRNQREYKKVFTEVLDKISIKLDEENKIEEPLQVKTDTVNKPIKRKTLK